MALTARMQALLTRTKANLVLQHDEDDELLLGFITAAIDYAEHYQKITYGRSNPPPSTQQAIVMLASHFYESRDGGTGGLFANSTYAAAQVWQAVNRLLAMNKEVVF